MRKSQKGKKRVANTKCEFSKKRDMGIPKRAKEKKKECIGFFKKEER